MSSDPYKRIRSGGKLRLKRNATAPTDGTTRQSKKSRRHVPEGEEESQDGEAVPVLLGTGRVVSSVTTLQGFETHFKEEVCAGDEILVHHPSTLKVETRTVVGILSDRSLTLNERFSSDLVSTTAFHIRKDSERLKREAEKALRAKNAKESSIGDDGAAEYDGAEGNAIVEDNDAKCSGGSEEGAPLGAAKVSAALDDELSQQLKKKLEKASKYQTVTYRQKTGMWGYKTVTERVAVSNDDVSASAEKQLEVRAKRMGRDKYCW